MFFFYQNEFGYSFSSKSQIPWITLNGVNYADSQFIIDFLSKQRSIDLNRNLTQEQKAIARAFLKLGEESLKWAASLQRAVYAPDCKVSGLSFFELFFASYLIKKRAKAQGFGRRTKEEVYDIGRADLKSINDLIGNKKFLFGNQVCNTDASLFGILCQFIYHDNGPLNAYIKGISAKVLFSLKHSHKPIFLDNCPNILRYVENIKKDFWPDWDENIRNKQTK